MFAYRAALGGGGDLHELQHIVPGIVVVIAQGAHLVQHRDRVYAPDGEFLALCKAEGGKVSTIKSFFEV